MSAGAVSMGALAFVSVGLWTLRVSLTARGRKVESAAVAAIEAVVFALVFSELVSDLDSWDRVLGYAIGVAVGTVAGLIVNERVNHGGVVIEAVVAGDGAALRYALHADGWPATSLPAIGVRGQATMVFVAVPVKRAHEVLSLIHATAPDAYWSVRHASAYGGLPAPPIRSAASEIDAARDADRRSVALRRDPEWEHSM